MAVQLPDAVLHVVLATNTYVPLVEAPVVPPAAAVVICADSVTAQPAGPAGIVAARAPAGDTDPVKLPTEPEIGARVPWRAPLLMESVNVPAKFVPFDCPPLHVPA